MLNQLLDLLPEINLSLASDDEWESLIINRRKPHTYRAWRMFGENRVCIHKFDPCFEDEVFAHPHPWPGAFLVLSGGYVHDVGTASDLDTEPTSWRRELLLPGSMYEITSMFTWHKVWPVEETYSIMLNGKPWSISHSQTRTTKGKDLEEMTGHQLHLHLNDAWSKLTNCSILEFKHASGIYRDAIETNRN